MISVRAYYDGHNYITEDSVTVKPNQKVIITYLDEETPQRPHRTLDEIKQYMNEAKSSEIENTPPHTSSEIQVRQLGGYEGQIKIAADFDTIPEGFEEYL